MERKQSPHNTPTLAAWVRAMRTRRELSARGIAHRLGWPEGTWASLEGGRVRSLTAQRVAALADLLGVHPWPLAILSNARPGRAPLDAVAARVVAAHPWPHPWWRERGAAFLRMARNDRSVASVAASWVSRWPAIPGLGEPEFWRNLETRGYLPDGTGLDRAPAPWVHGLLAAIIDDDDAGLYLLPGYWFAVGRADRAVADAFGGTEAYDQLASAYRQCYVRHGTEQQFDDGAYFRAAASVAEHLRESARQPTAMQRLTRITDAWPYLSPQDQEHVVAIVLGLAHRRGDAE